MLQNDAWLQPALKKPPIVDQMVIVCALPLYHIFALTACYLLGVRAGGTNLLIPNPRDMAGFVKELGEVPGQLLPGRQHALQRPVEHARLRQARFLQAENLQRRRHGDAKTGCREMAEDHRLRAVGRLWPVRDLADADLQPRRHRRSSPATIGLPVPSTYLSIRDDDGKEVPLGEAGEICAKGPQVMAGYWKRPEETANVMTADGYFRTGDIGVMDADGYTKIVDRKKDMILVSGFNVYPNEIEEVIASHPGVLECAVIGVQDAKSGEAVKAFIVKKDPNLTPEDIIKFCGTQLTAYKVPKQIEFRTDLPKTNVGKILRRELRDEKKAAA